MSVSHYLACHECKTYVWIAQDGLSGFTFYSGEPQCMKALQNFFDHHSIGNKGHRLEMLSEHQLEDDAFLEYAEIEWPTLGKSVEESK